MEYKQVGVIMIMREAGHEGKQRLGLNVGRGGRRGVGKTMREGRVKECVNAVTGCQCSPLQPCAARAWAPLPAVPLLANCGRR